MTKPRKRYHGSQKNTPYKLGESPNFGALSRGEAVCRRLLVESHCPWGALTQREHLLGESSYAEGTRKRETIARYPQNKKRCSIERSSAFDFVILSQNLAIRY